MKKKYTLFILPFLLLLAACNKKAVSPTTTVEVTVTSGITATPVANAIVNLYTDSSAVFSGSSKYSQLTNANGQVKITVAYASKYYVTAQFNGVVNYFRGLIPIGVFATQTEIDDSPAQTPAGYIGGPKFQDTNGDGIITSADNVAPPSVNVIANTNNTFNTTIY